MGGPVRVKKYFDSDGGIVVLENSVCLLGDLRAAVVIVCAARSINGNTEDTKVARRKDPCYLFTQSA